MITIQEIQADKAFFDLKQEWQELEPRVKDLTVFQTWVFQYHCWKIFEKQVHLNILVFRKDDRLVGCVPLGWQLQKIGPLSIKTLGFACIKYCDFHNAIVDEQYSREIVGMFSSWLLDNRSRWDDIELRLIRDDFSLCLHKEFLVSGLGKDMEIEEEGIAPYVTIQPDWTDFQNALSGKRAKSVRYEIRNLFKHFDGEFKKHDSGKDLLNALQTFMDLHQKRIRQKYQLGAFATPEIRNGFARLVQALEQYQYINIYTIENDVKTVAAIGTFVHNKTVSYFQGGFDTDLYRFSPGKVVLALRITTAVQEKQAEFDFLFGDEDYKFSWSTGQRKLYRYHICTGSWKQGLWQMMNNIRARLQESYRFRALYFKLTRK